jgi:rod shape-determining protein MreB
MMVVDLGGGGTDVSLLALSGIVASQTEAGGGDGLDSAIASYLAEQHQLAVGSTTARTLKHTLGSADPGAWLDETRHAEAKGRCTTSGTPKSVRVSVDEIATALERPLATLAATVRSVLESAPPELSSDVADSGMLLVGGGALLHGIEHGLRERTGLPAFAVEQPEHAVVAGAGQILADTNLSQAMAS